MTVSQIVVITSRAIALCAIAPAMTIAMTSPVFAQQLGSATFADGVERPLRVASEGALWRCDGSTCTGSGPTRLKDQVRVCTDLTRHGGQITAFRIGDYSFSADDLARCNRHVDEIHSVQTAKAGEGAQ